MKKFNFPILSGLLLVFMLIGVGCNTDKSSTDQIKETVMIYMQHTLGTIPGAEVNYGKARLLVTPDLQEQFENPMFVPASYCIQDGPQDVRILSIQPDVEMNWTNVVVEGNYGYEWIEMWNFKVVKVEDGTWRINEIKCLNT